MFQVTKMNEKENKKENNTCKAFQVKRESLYLTAIYNGWVFREVFGDKRGFGEGWGLREYLQLWWGFGELSRFCRVFLGRRACLSLNNITTSTTGSTLSTNNGRCGNSQGGLCPPKGFALTHVFTVHIFS
jgi:hypothetical protein